MNWRDVLARLRAAAPAADALDVIEASTRMPVGLSRRAFLRTALIGTTVAALIDVDHLLWMPGEKALFLPSAEISLNWLEREWFALITKNLAVARLVNREYSQRADAWSRMGERMQVRLPKRYVRGLA